MKKIIHREIKRAGRRGGRSLFGLALRSLGDFDHGKIITILRVNVICPDLPALPVNVISVISPTSL
jgi:hypothetical protein